MALTKAINKIGSNLTKRNVKFWQRAQTQLNKLSSRTPLSGEGRAFGFGIKKMQTAIDTGSYKQWNSILRQLLGS